MVHINYDGETLFWQTDPGAFLFTAQEQFQGGSYAPTLLAAPLPSRITGANARRLLGD
jgi:hypothetical protein